MSNQTALVVATTPVPEVVPATPQTPAQAPLQSTAFSQLAKKEAELVRQRSEFKKEQEATRLEKAKVEEYQKKIQAYEQAKQTDPVAALKMLGFSEQDIFNYMASQQKTEPTAEEKAAQAAAKAADEKIRAFEEQQTRRLLHEQQQKDQSLIAGFKSELGKALQQTKDSLEYCAYYGPEAEDLAYEITLAVVKESKGQEILTPHEALQMAEEYFEERDKEMSTLKKRKAQSVPIEAPKPKQPERTRTVTPADPREAPKPTITKTRTLTNAATSTVASSRLTRNETREEKRERLIQALKDGVKL